jgi:hypothetical protein
MFVERRPLAGSLDALLADSRAGARAILFLIANGDFGTCPRAPAWLELTLDHLVNIKMC